MSDEARTDRPTMDRPTMDRPTMDRPTRVYPPRRREWGWWLAALGLLGLVGSIGCNPIQMANFALMPFANNNNPPNCSLEVPGKESKVVLIVKHENAEFDLTFKDAPDVIARRLSSLLEQRYKDNGDKIKLVPISKVQAYLAKNRDWVTISKEEIGKHFEADYVVCLDLMPMTLYENGSRGGLYRGNVEIHITVIDVSQPEAEGVKYHDIYTCSYPRRGAEDSGSMSPTVFRLRFLDHVARDLVPYFAACPSKDKFDSE